MPTLRSLLLTLLIATALLGAWLISTTEGARWLAARAEAMQPALTVEITTGSLWGGLTAESFRWREGRHTVVMDAVTLAWTPGCLLEWRVCIDELVVDGLRVEQRAESGSSAEADPSPPDNPLDRLPEAIELPAIDLPVDVVVNRLSVDGLKVQQTGRPIVPGVEAVELQARLIGRELSIANLSVSGTAGSANLTGGVTMAGGWPVAVDWALAPAAELTAGQAVRVTGELRGTADDLAVQGGISGARSATFSLNLSALSSPRALDARIETAGNDLAVAARIDSVLDIEGELQADALEDLWPGLDGRLAGEFRITGAPMQPAVTADLAADGLRYAGIGLDSARLEADWQAARGGTARLEMAGIERDGASLGKIRLALEGRPDDHRIEVDASRGGSDLSLALEGSLDAAAPAWRGRITRSDVTIEGERGTLAGTPSLAVNPDAIRLGAHCWVWDQVRACAEPLMASPESAEWRVSLSSVPLALLEPRLPAGFRLPGSVTGTATLNWQPDSGPAARLTLVSANSAIEVPQPEAEEALMLRYDRIVVDADLQPEKARVRLGVASPDIGQGGFALETDPRAAGRPLSGTVWMEGLSLAPLAGALPQLRSVSGQLGASGTLNGTLAAPRFQGDIVLRDATLLPAALVTPLEQIDVTASIDGGVASIEGGFSAGTGEASIGGELDWRSGALDGVIDLAGEQLAINVGTLAQLSVTPDIRLAIAPDTVSLTGAVTIPAARIEPGGRSPGAIRPSPDAVRVDAAGEPVADAAATNGGRTLESDLRLVLGDAVRFSASGATGRLDGALRLRQIGTGNTEAEGVLNLIEASYEAYGQSLQVQRGRVIFAGPITQPRLDVEAVREAPGITAGLQVTGSVDNPEIRLFSRPPMAQTDILSVLITGRPPGQESPSEEALLSRAALSLGVFGGGRLGESLADELGIENFQVEADGQGDEAQVAVSGYLSPNLMVRYGVGVFEPGNTFSLRYYLSRQFYLEAVSGAENAFDIFYSFDYD